jgi:DNA-binding response OmpR family regulator
MLTVLVVEDNTDMLELFCTVLSDSGYHCLPATNGEDALEIIEKNYIDLIVADIMMPRMDGYELAKSLREADYDLPILMVTAKDQFEDMQKGFESGTDDYMIKPINAKELVLRVGALLRRAKISREKKIIVGSTMLDYDALTVTIHGEETILPQKEFYLLYKLLSYPNKVFTRLKLMDEIWGMFTESDERTVNTHINRLRERFADCNDFEIITVRGLGYKAVKNGE